MKENKYDDERFFGRYSGMARSVEGLRGAGEWHVLRRMLPDLKGVRMLDLGCGFGWHCGYAAEHGAAAVTGIDISRKMIEAARVKNPSPVISYECMPIEDYPYPENAFDVVISSLAFHYLESFGDIAAKVYGTLSPGGSFVFSVEHPVFTASGDQRWIEDLSGNRLYWPVDRYFTEGVRQADFLGEEVTKYHRTLTTYVQSLLDAGFTVKELEEPQPEEAMLAVAEGMKDELRRPMMLIVSAVKP